MIEMKKLLGLTHIADERTLKTYLQYLEKAELIATLSHGGLGLKALRKPDKLYLNNPNLMYALSSVREVNIGAMREVFFINALRIASNVGLAKIGDFIVDKKFIFEVGGPNKSAEQIQNKENAYLALDGIEQGVKNTIPLWMFGFFY